jgi:predicted NAD-dependent protein-ADP-ribosyltransferase YbiA (DUF1768 family)
MRRLAITLALAGLAVPAWPQSPFPEHWFKPIAEDQAQWWEILPQEAAPGEVILSKRHELGTFSNLAPTPFYFHGKHYASVEGFWYSLAYPEGPDDPRAKAPGLIWKFTRDQVSQMTMFDAKDAGGLAEQNMAAMGINWVTFEGKQLKYMSTEKGEHYQLITKVIWEKVRQNPKVKDLLLSTGDLILKPDNFDSLRELPAWRYFDIYMEIRSVLRSGADLPPTERYPVHWWTPVSEVNKPDWEILAQAAKPGEVILSKRHELGILSNFGATPFTLHGKRYASVEGFWQMMLYPEGPDDPRAKAPGIVWAHTREEVGQMTGFDAKDAGTLAYDNMQKMGIDWVSFEGKKMTYWSKEPGEHYQLILEAMRAKLEQNPKVAEILLSTGDLLLLPDHFQEDNPPAEWLYFKIWMALRSQLQAAL